MYRLSGLEVLSEQTIPTPFGCPSDTILIGRVPSVSMQPIAFLPRHGRHHTHLPSEINYRANIWALKSLGVRYLVSVSAVGSLAEENRPCDVVLPTQFVDRTRGRKDTFFGNGCVAHVGFAHPVCEQLHAVVEKACVQAVQSANNAVGVERVACQSRVHAAGTYVCIDGPAFSTRAESFSYRQVGGTVIGMTAYQEAKLAREAEIAFALVALVTDYDGWHPEHAAVTVDMVMANLRTIGSLAQDIVTQIVAVIEANGFPRSDAHSALQFAIMTPKERVPENTKQALSLLANKYWNLQDTEKVTTTTH